MPNDKNKQQYSELADRLDQVEGVVFVDYKGLTHSQLEELRVTIEEADSKLSITKNRLMKIAVDEKFEDASEAASEQFTGPTATLFMHSDVVEPVKKLAEFIKTYDLPVIKGGIIESKFADSKAIDTLSKLPSKEELIGKLMGQIQAPLYGLAYVLNAPLQNLVYALNAIKDSKGGEGDG